MELEVIITPKLPVTDDCCKTDEYIPGLYCFLFKIHYYEDLSLYT
jgi:hypothetical protein